MLLTPYGTREWLGLTIIALLLAAAPIWLGWWWLVVVIAIVWLAVLSFFRDPPRRLPANLQSGDMVSPADGVISAIEHVDSHPAIISEGPAIIIRIFLSVLNVHVNRAPCDGEVIALKHTAGQYLNAQTPESAKVNESNLITVRISSEIAGTDETIGIRQVAGMIARRIVCPLKPGNRLARGDRFGMIKFGSTTELILPRPDDVEVFVKQGDSVKGVLTILARLNRPSMYESRA